MAKLSARGRFERLRLEHPYKGDEYAGDPNGGFRQRAYMSDGNILARYRVGSSGPASTWTVSGRVKPNLSPRQIAEIREPQGWHAVQSDRLRTPRYAGDLSEIPIITQAKADTRTRARARSVERQAERLAAAQEQARTIPVDAVRRFVDRQTGSIHVGESLRFWVRSIMGRLQGGTATFRLMPRSVRKATIRHIAVQRRARVATYRAVMGHAPYPTERAIGAQILGRVL